MSSRRPSRFAVAALDLVAARNEPLRGDLLEEFERGRSRRWLWRQIIGALGSGRRLPSEQPRQSTEMTVIGAIVIVLVSFEAIFVTNVVDWLIFGPPAPDISGYLYVFHLLETPRSVFGWPSAPIALVLLAWCSAIAIGWFVERIDREHPIVSRVIFAVSTLVCAALNLDLRFGAQFLTMMVFVVGLLVGGRLAGGARQWQASAV